MDRRTALALGKLEVAAEPLAFGLGASVRPPAYKDQLTPELGAAAEDQRRASGARALRRGRAPDVGSRVQGRSTGDRQSSR
jgi:hypothetical protein